MSLGALGVLMRRLQSDVSAMSVRFELALANIAARLPP
jgi:hypothetical protein